MKLVKKCKNCYYWIGGCCYNVDSPHHTMRTGRNSGCKQWVEQEAKEPGGLKADTKKEK